MSIQTSAARLSDFERARVSLRPNPVHAQGLKSPLPIACKLVPVLLKAENDPRIQTLVVSNPGVPLRQIASATQLSRGVEMILLFWWTFCTKWSNGHAGSKVQRSTSMVVTATPVAPTQNALRLWVNGYV